MCIEFHSTVLQEHKLRQQAEESLEQEQAKAKEREEVVVMLRETLRNAAVSLHQVCVCACA